MRELAVQGANDTNGTDDRANIRRELTELHEKLTRSKTRPNGFDRHLFPAQHLKFQIGDEANEQLTVATTAIASSSLSVGSTRLLSDFISNLHTLSPRSTTPSRRLRGTAQNMVRTQTDLTTLWPTWRPTLSPLRQARPHPDTDYAAETTDLAKSQILQQAATSMLAQANASKQTILSLIQG